MNPEVESLSQRFSNLPDGELLRVVTVERGDYRQMALDLAAKELMRRGVPFILPAAEKPAPIQSGPVTTFGRPAARGRVKNYVRAATYIGVMYLLLFLHVGSLSLPGLDGIPGWLVTILIGILLLPVFDYIDRKLTDLCEEGEKKSRH